MTPGNQPLPFTATYLYLRRAIGMLSLLFPFLLVIGLYIATDSFLLPTLSDYYHYTDVRDLFVGVLCAIGVFLWSYKGYENSLDNIAGNIASVSIIGTALVPNSREETNIVGWFKDTIGFNPHVILAGVFMLMMAFFCLAQFTQTGNTAPGNEKLKRNRIYRICGWLILACIALIIVFMLADKYTDINLKPIENAVFWLESIAIWAFSFAWLVKGETFWRDRVS